MRQPREPTDLEGMRSSFNLASYVLESFCMAFLPILRRTFGVRGMEGYSFVGMLIIIGFGCMASSPGMLFGYFPLWLLCVIWKRLSADPFQHSFYQGFPLTTGWLFRNEYLARCAEAALLLLLGAWLSRLDAAVGVFVTGGGFGLMGKYILEHTLRMRRIRAAIDWQAEAEQWQAAMQEAARFQQRGR